MTISSSVHFLDLDGGNGVMVEHCITALGLSSVSPGNLDILLQARSGARQVGGATSRVAWE
ncbi:MAG TPA: hypothetical protein VH184_05920 [Dongiaceae bacterium]|nr:hypothetical protein [Dongiaceae bacterium]